MTLSRIALPADILTMSAVDREAWFAQWFQTPEGKQTLAGWEERRQKRWAPIGKDGTFYLLDETPGRYVLTIDSFVPTPRGT